MSSRLQSLIDRGYDKDEVEKLASFSEDELKIAADTAFNHFSKGCYPTKTKQAIFIGGQPGSGKTVLLMDLKNHGKNYVEIGIDNYRMYHPRYLEIEKVIKNHWIGKKETENDSPGNDIASFTHLFAGKMTDEIMNKCIEKGYNMLVEWGMRYYEEPLMYMKKINQCGYSNEIIFLATNEKISYHACNLRSDLMNEIKGFNHVIRKVPKDFHDLSVSQLPTSMNIIYKTGTEKKYINSFQLITRDKKLLWKNGSFGNPGDVFSNFVHKSLTNDYNNAIDVININRVEMMGIKEHLEEEYNNKTI
jgi:hypothetical protein